MLKEFLDKPVICPHSQQEKRFACCLPGGCPTCLKTRVRVMEKLLGGIDTMTTEISKQLGRLPQLKGQTLTEAVRLLVDRCLKAEADLKVATSPKAMGERNAKIEAELKKALVWTGEIQSDERIDSWVHGADEDLHEFLTNPPMDFDVLNLGENHGA